MSNPNLPQSTANPLNAKLPASGPAPVPVQHHNVALQQTQPQIQAQTVQTQPQVHGQIPVPAPVAVPSSSSTPNPIAAPAVTTTQLHANSLMMANNAPVGAAGITGAAGIPNTATTVNAPAGMGMAVAPIAANAAASAVPGVPGAPGGKDEYEEIREQDRYLPIANIARIMKNTLPDNAKIAKDSKETVQECVSEFISFITSEASDKCMQEKRKTINGDDLLWAMSTLGFDKYVEPLKIYLTKYREAIRGDKPDGKGKGSGANSGSGRPSTNAAVVGSGIGLPTDLQGVPPS